MYYHSMWVNHRKNLYRFPKVQNLMNTIKEFLKDTYPTSDIDIESIVTYQQLIDIATPVQMEMDKITEGKEYLDLYNI